MSKVIIICYGNIEEREKDEAIRFYMNCMMSSEGSEQSRYANICSQLMSNYCVCSDGEYTDEEVIVKLVKEALKKYGSDVISVDLNEETDFIEINECHHSHSNVIYQEIAHITEIDTNELVAKLDKLGVGHCGI